MSCDLSYLLRLNLMYAQFEHDFPGDIKWLLKVDASDAERIIRSQLEAVSSVGPSSRETILLMLRTEIKRISSLIEPPL